MNRGKVIKLAIWVSIMVAVFIIPLFLTKVVLDVLFDELTSTIIALVIVMPLICFYIDRLHVYSAVKLKLPELLRCYDEEFQYKMQKLMGNGN